MALAATSCSEKYSFNPPALTDAEAAPPIPGTTAASIQLLRPTLAVRGLNCLLCHGSIGSSVVTDFGHNSDTNGLMEIDSVSQHFYGPSRTAFNDTENGTTIGGWQTGSIYGNLYIPEEPISAADSSTLFGTSTAVSYSTLMSWSQSNNPLNLTIQMPQAPMSSVLKAQGSTNPEIIPLPAIHIGYPTPSQIVAQVSGATLQQAPTVYPVSNDGTQSVVTGLDASSGNTFIRNGTAANPGSVSCMGDIVVIGPLFLKNATINTDNGGCRIYATGTIIIQGSLSIQGSTNANLQLSSAKAVLMGFDLLHLGYAFGLNGSNERVSSFTQTTLPDTTSYVRFCIEDDLGSSYPTNYPDEFSSAKAFFDSIVQDAVLIDGGHLVTGKTGQSNWTGGELVDAFSLTQPSAPAAAVTGGYRLTENYSHIVLNAPQIHSRYTGTVSGVIIADKALFVLSGSVTSGLGVNFSYDPIFDSVSQVLPLFPKIFTTGPLPSVAPSPNAAE